MEAKKSPKANIDKQKPVFLKVGILLALALVLFAFEWKSYTGTEEIVGKTDGKYIPTEVVIQTDKPKPPDKPIVDVPMSSAIINVVDVGGSDLTGLFKTDDTATYIYPLTAAPIEDEVIDVTPLIFAEDMPVYPGGEDALFAYIRSNIKYPRESIEINSQGIVYTTFVVERDGRLTDISILRGVDVFLDKEALRVVSQMSKWKPGYQRGKAVRVQFTLPIKFELRQ